MSDEKNYWVITSSEAAYGPFESENEATTFASTNLGEYGWTITYTQ